MDRYWDRKKYLNMYKANIFKTRQKISSHKVKKLYRAHAGYIYHISATTFDLNGLNNLIRKKLFL